MSYAGEARFRFDGPADRCSRYIPIARVLVERTYAMYDIGGGGAEAATQTKRFASGAWIRVTVFDKVPPIITISTSGERYTSKETTVDLNYWFQEGDLSFNSRFRPEYTRARFIPANPTALLDGTSGSGSWKVLSTPPSRPITRGFFFSKDLMLDGQPRYIVSWEHLGSTNFSGYYVNGNSITTAPGVVVGVVQDRRQKWLITRVSETPLVLSRWDWTDGEWVQGWSVEMPCDTMRTTLRMRPDSAQAVFVGAKEAQDGAFTYEYTRLIVTDLVTGAPTIQRDTPSDGSYGVFNNTRTVVDTDPPYGTCFGFRLSSTITASVDSSVGINSGPDSGTPMPRIGDAFTMVAPAPNPPDGEYVDTSESDGRSIIEVTSISYTPLSVTAGQLAATGTMGFSWTNAAYFTIRDSETDELLRVEDGVHASGTKPTFYNISGSFAIDASETLTRVTDGVELLDCGYTHDGLLTYVETEVHNSYTYVFLQYMAGSERYVEESIDEIDTSVTRLVVGGVTELTINAPNSSYTFYEINGFDVSAVGTGDNPYETITGTALGEDLVEQFFPGTTEMAAKEEVGATATDIIIADLNVDLAAYIPGLFLAIEGNVYYFARSMDPAAIQSDNYRYIDQRGGYLVIDIVSAAAPTVSDFPFKEIKSSLAYGPFDVAPNEGAQIPVVDKVEANIFDLSDTGTLSRTLSVGYSDDHLAAASYDITDTYINESLFNPHQQLAESKIAHDAYRNVIYCAPRDLSFVIRKPGFGYLHRSTADYAATDPRPLFLNKDVLDVDGNPTPVDVLDKVSWGVTTSEYRVETDDDADKDAAGETVKRLYEQTYRRP